MKNGCCIFSIFILLFISQVSGIIHYECRKDGFSELKVCTACVEYSCPDLREKKYARGCPEDFFRECSSQKAAISLIKSKGANEMVYFDSVVSYITGCYFMGDYDDGSLCLFEKVNSESKRKKELEEQGQLNPGEIYWHSKTDSSLNEKRSKLDKSPSKETPGNNNTTEKNGALKFIGIFSIGWMLLFAAAWIY